MSSPLDFDALRAPFPYADIGWRVGARNQDKTKGQALPYISARDVQNRLDKVAGPANWQVKFSAAPTGNGLLCALSLRVGGEWVEKQDVAQQDREESAGKSAAGANKGASQDMALKGAASDAFKRAAVMWGIGRYLYDYDAPWVKLKDDGKYLAEYPVFPSHMLPANEPKREGGRAAATGTTSGNADPATPAAAGSASSTSVPATTPAPARAPVGTTASGKPLYDSSVAGDMDDPSADDYVAPFQSSVAGDVDDPTAPAPAPSKPPAETGPTVGTKDEWAALPEKDRDTVRFLAGRIRKGIALRNVESFLTEGNGTTQLPLWAREGLLALIPADARSA
jgi:hypothetical protein